MTFSGGLWQLLGNSAVNTIVCIGVGTCLECSLPANGSLPKIPAETGPSAPGPVSVIAAELAECPRAPGAGKSRMRAGGIRSCEADSAAALAIRAMAGR